MRLKLKERLDRNRDLVRIRVLAPAVVIDLVQSLIGSYGSLNAIGVDAIVALERAQHMGSNKKSTQQLLGHVTA